MEHGDAPHEGLLKVERHGFWCLGFRCSGFRCLGFRVWGFGVWGFGVLGFGVLGFTFWIEGEKLSFFVFC